MFLAQANRPTATILNFKKGEAGSATLGIILFVFIGVLVLGLRTQIDRREDQASLDSIVASFAHLAQAQYRHYTDPTAATAGGYAATPDILVNRGYLPIWNGTSSWSFNLLNGLEIEWLAPDIASARAVQSRMPNLTNVIGTLVRVGFADTQDLALLDTYVSKAGDSMQGALTFDAGIGQALDLNQNTILDVSHLVVVSPDGSAILEVDSIVAKTVLAGDFVLDQ